MSWTPEWYAIAGLFSLILAQDYRQDFESGKRHLYRWASFSVLGLILLGVGIYGATR